MAEEISKPVISNHTFNSVQPEKVNVMRNNQKVARVSLCCKLNMLVPQLQRLSSRLQHEKCDTSRSKYNLKQ